MNILVKNIESFAYKCGKDNKRVMSDLLQYIIGSFNPEPEPNPLWPYTKEQNAEFFKMLGAYITLMQGELRKKTWYDAWGDMFQYFTPKGGMRGQFFTPDVICDLMAEVSDPTKAEPRTVCGAFGKRVTVSDPTCGSGRNLLTVHAKFLADNVRPPYLIAEDIDIDCCRMTAVNMMVHGCFGEVICHDTLTDPKGIITGFIVNEGLYPIPGGLPTIRVSRERERFIALRDR